MAIQSGRTDESVVDYFRRLENSCPMSDVKLWRTVKGIVYAIVLWTAALIIIGQYGADPLPTFAISVAASVIFFIGEVEEIRLANWMTAVFEREGENK